MSKTGFIVLGGWLLFAVGFMSGWTLASRQQARPAAFAVSAVPVCTGGGCGRGGGGSVEPKVDTVTTVSCFDPAGNKVSCGSVTYPVQSMQLRECNDIPFVPPGYVMVWRKGCGGAEP